MSDRIFELAAGPFGAGELVVARFEGREEISRCHSFDVTVAARDIDPVRVQRELLGAPARLTFRTATGDARRIGGVVRWVELKALDATAGLTWWTLQLVPRLWLLERRQGCRVFQDKTVPEIVDEVLGAGRVQHRWLLAREQLRRSYCVQYHETDLAFVERLLAEQGLFYFMQDPPADTPHTESEVMICADMAEAYLDRAADGPLPYRPGAEGAAAGGAVESVTWRHDLRAESIRTAFYDYRRPQVDFSERAEAAPADRAASPVRLEHDAYQFELEEAGVDPAAARLELEQERARSLVGGGRSRCRDLAPGQRFVLSGHPLETLNRAYVALRVEHTGSLPEAAGFAAGASAQESYSNRFWCLPAEVPARPARPLRRLQQVVETATVVGPRGEEIHTDELGRIKVQFHWDREGERDEHSSCWLRVMQPWAGAAWGAQFIPRVGMEVIVSFAGGDTDRPVALGSVYNGTLPPPFPLPEEKTRSGWRTRTTPGGSRGNELVFDDAAEAERVFLHAERDLEQHVERDHARSVQHDEVVSVQGDRTTTVGGDHVRTVFGNEVVTVEKNFALHVVGKQLIVVDGQKAEGAVGTHRDADLGEFAAAARADAGIDAGAAAAAPELEPTGPRPSLLDAKLTWQLSQLPLELHAAGDRIEGFVAGPVARLALLRGQVATLWRDSARLRQRRRDPILRWADVSAVNALRERAEPTRRSAAELAERVAEALDNVAADEDQRLEKLQDAARDRLFAVENETEALEERIELGLQRADPTQPSRRSVDAPGDELPRAGGEEHGGGGATEGFKDAETMHFMGPPNDKGERSWVAAEGGSRLDIKGGGEILSPDGFRIASGSCVLEMSSGIITLAAPQVDIMAGTVNIQGSVVTVKGNPIKLN